jgi:hypothetical protein
VNSFIDTAIRHHFRIVKIMRSEVEVGYAHAPPEGPGCVAGHVLLHHNGGPVERLVDNRVLSGVFNKVDFVERIRDGNCVENFHGDLLCDLKRNPEQGLP